MSTWNNDPIVLYHGCTNQSLRPAHKDGIATGSLPHHIDIAFGSPVAEFGRGFYATTSLAQAKSWANTRARRIAARTKSPPPTAVVISFDADRNQLSTLEALVFTNELGDFWNFVYYCRSGSTPHARQNWPRPQYDAVYGPVSIWPQPLVIKDTDQVSFHTDKGLQALPAAKIAFVGNPYL
jgi:hypothetical protein